MNIIGIINIIAFLILATIGLVFTIKKRKDFINIVQLQIDKKTIIGFLTMLFVSGFIMFFIFLINLKLGLLEIISRDNVFLLIKNIPIEFINAMGEEFLFRILVFLGLLFLIDNKIIALALSSIMFCFMHTPESMISIVSYMFAGLMYGIAFLTLRTIWAPIGLHFGWNYFQGIVFGFPVSNQISDGYLLLEIVDSAMWNGGNIGPEGSIVGIFGRIVIIITILIIGFIICKRMMSDQFLRIE